MSILNESIDEKSAEQQHLEDLERLKQFCPLHDTFARSLFRNNLPLAQFVLRIITNIDDLVLTKEETQYDLKHLTGARSVCLDVYGTDSAGRTYNIEIERSDEGAAPERAEYHMAAMNTEHMSRNDEFVSLPETYVIFVTEADQIGDGKPVHRYSYRDDETNTTLGGKTHILYVNGAYNDDSTDIGKLMHDFRCTNADDMYFNEMADRTRYLKEDPKGVSEMCAIMEELKKESEQRGEQRGEHKRAIMDAQNMIEKGLGSFEDIAEVTGLSIETVRELAGKKTA